MIEKKQLTELKKDIALAKHIVFLTGAGVSTHSNIPDYRSKNGIYHGISESPETILSQETLFKRPEIFYHFVMKNMYFPDAQPNLIHQKIAEICNQKGNLITQNVDGLDKKAGNKKVTEFHGNLYQIYCTKCQHHIDYLEYAHSFRHQNCGGIIRPGIVLYGEAINTDTLTKAVKIMQQSDLIIICGTSFVVYPFAQLLSYKQSDTKIWAINKTEIPATNISEIIDDAINVFKQI